MSSSVIRLAAQTSETSGTAINPYLVGGIALGILLFALLVLLMFGKGRDHS